MELLLKTKTLMEQRSLHSDLYNEQSHQYLLSQLPHSVFLPLSLSAPLPSPLMTFHADPWLHWPQHTWWNYCWKADRNDALLPFLRLGYVVVKDTLMRCAFFISNDEVVDPIARMKNIDPDYYVGVPIEKRDMQTYLHNRTFDTNPLELFVERKIAMAT